MNANPVSLQQLPLEAQCSLLKRDNPPPLFVQERLVGWRESDARFNTSTYRVVCLTAAHAAQGSRNFRYPHPPTPATVLIIQASQSGHMCFRQIVRGSLPAELPGTVGITFEFDDFHRVFHLVQVRRTIFLSFWVRGLELLKLEASDKRQAPPHRKTCLLRKRGGVKRLRPTRGRF